MTSFEKNKGENRLKRGEILLDPLFPSHVFPLSFQHAEVQDFFRKKNSKPKNLAPHC